MIMPPQIYSPRALHTHTHTHTIRSRKRQVVVALPSKSFTFFHFTEFFFLERGQEDKYGSSTRRIDIKHKIVRNRHLRGRRRRRWKRPDKLSGYQVERTHTHTHTHTQRHAQRERETLWILLNLAVVCLVESLFVGLREAFLAVVFCLLQQSHYSIKSSQIVLPEPI